jgi:hypothetical protein
MTAHLRLPVVVPPIFRSFLAVLCLGLAVCPAVSQVVYTSAFSAGAGPEWSNPTTGRTPNGTSMLGRFGNESVRLSLDSLPAHTYVGVTFDVYAIQGWDGNANAASRDVFTVRVAGGLTLLDTSFSNTSSRQSYPEACPYGDYSARKSAYRSNTLGYSSPGDTTYRISRTIPHRADSLQVDFAAQGLPSGAGWGLNSVRVTLFATNPGSTLGNGDFELPAVTSASTYTPSNPFTAWTVVSGNVTIRKGWQTASGEQCLDLAGTAAGAIRQDVPVAPNQQYDLRFRLAGNPTTAPAVKQVQVLWNGTLLDTLSFDTTGRTVQDLGWEPHHYLVVAPSTASTVPLTFQAVSDGSGGPLLDAVSVTPVVTGDVNDDGSADLRDAAAAVRLVAGTATPDTLSLVRADIAPWVGTGGRRYGNGLVDLEDVRLALRLGSGLLGYLDIAQSAMRDLYARFWIGTVNAGHVLPTWGGLYNTSFPNGSLWEHAQMLRTITDLYRVTGDPELLTRIRSDWAWILSHHSRSARTSVGAGTNMNWSDDAGWSALMYLDVYRATGDATALSDAATLFTNTYERWADDTYGGGLWYTDEHLQKSVYQVSIILAGLRLYDITGNRVYADRALSLYHWVVSHLERGKGLYYVDYNANGPAKNNAPPKQASSDTMLAGNMAMAVVAARLYRATNDPVYLERALFTANAILAVENDGAGVYLNDRDANVEGFYIGDWVAEVLTLPGIEPEHADTLRRTALSIYTAARTTDGYYSGNWSGPAQGPLVMWGADGKSFIPQQIVISANSVHMIVGAAAIGALAPETARPLPQSSLVPTSEAQGVVWRYTTTAPASDWYQPAFDASTWSEGPGGFGTAGTPGAVVRTTWNTGDIWLRKTFDLASIPDGLLSLRIHHDENAEVYLNGVLAASFTGYTTSYITASVSAAAAASLHAGQNVMAVHCHQTGGGQYIDAGLDSGPAS